MKISQDTRRRFAEFAAVSVPVVQLNRIWQRVGLPRAPDSRDPRDQRDPDPARSAHGSVDWSNGDHLAKVLQAYDAAIVAHGTTHLGTMTPKAAALAGALRSDGFAVTERGRITIPAHLEPDVTLPLMQLKLLSPLERGELERHVKRVEANLADDPAAAIGSAKEFLEAICEVILRHTGVEHERGAPLPWLYRKVADVLRLNEHSVPDNPAASDAVGKCLRSLITTVQGLAELRNLLGSGHGRADRSRALRRHAALAYSSAYTVGSFLLTTWHDEAEAMIGTARDATTAV